MDRIMQPFIVSAIRTITQSLHDSALSTSNETPAPNLPESLREFDLDGAPAEVVGNGSLIYPNPDLSADYDWCVLRLAAVDRARCVRVFHLGARLHATLSSAHFVRRAYEHILMRPIDPEGLKIYPPLIDSRRLTRRAVLTTLVDSVEARALMTRLVIVPHPSAWLEGLELDGSGDASFPAVAVKTEDR
jgi:hypothetical protein